MNRTIGWASLAVGIATGLVMGLWSFDGPLPPPAWLGEYGDTPRRLYARLAADPTWPAAQTEFFFGDERAVRPEHPDSNYRMAHETLLAPLRVDPARVHRIEAERADLDAAALAYEAELVRALGAGKDVLPRLDCVLLGMGAEYAFSPNWSAFLEYNYMEFDTKNAALDLSALGGLGAGAVTGNVGFKNKLSIAKVGVNYKF